MRRLLERLFRPVFNFFAPRRPGDGDDGSPA